jgi:hypothetical protein
VLGVLAAVNRAGFITNGSQVPAGNGEPEQAWVYGWVPAPLLPALMRACAGLTVTACRRRVHAHQPQLFWGCDRRDAIHFWSYHCPHVTRQLRQAWYVVISDPVAGRNTELWPALGTFTAGQPPCCRP